MGPFKFLSLLIFSFLVYAAPPGWHFVQNGTTGIVAIETMVISPTLAILFDRPQDNPLQINGTGVWGALWNFETNTATPLNLLSNTFCASGGFLSNGTMVSVGGTHVEDPATEPDADGRMLLRLIEPCTDANGVGCKVIEDPATLHLVEKRWYPSSLRLFDGSLMIIGGTQDTTNFYNVQPVNSFEFFPPKDNGVPRASPFIERSLPANLFPRGLALPDGRVFIAANNQTIIYDVETQEETRLPDIPNGIRITNPFDGTATLLPLTPPLYTPEVLVCGGSPVSDTIPPMQLSSQDPATDQCSRMVLTKRGIERGWIIEHMPEGRVMPEMILLPDGRVLITNGAGTGYAAINSVHDAIDAQSNSDHPVLTPVLYIPDAPLGRRFSRKDLPTSDIPRIYHSTASLTPAGNIFVAGSNPHSNPGVRNNTSFPTEFRVEYLNPPYMSVARPVARSVPKTIQFNHVFRISVDIPSNLKANNIQVALMDLGFSSHAFHSSSRLVFMRAVLSKDRKSLEITSPPNNRVYPPGPAWIFITVDGITSTGSHVMVGNGLAPPVSDQGIPLPV